MRYIFPPVFFLLLLQACISPTNHNANNLRVKNPDAFNKDSTNLILPASFKLDSLKQFDSSTNIEVILQYPVYKNDSDAINRQLNTILSQHLNDFLKHCSKDLSGISNSFDVNTISLNVDSQLINYCFIITIYQSPAAHPSAIYYSFNFDLAKSKQVFFSDYFNLSTSKDTAAFKKIINLAMERPADFGIHYLARACFNPSKHSIEFLMDDFCQEVLANETVKVKIPKKDLEQFIKNPLLILNK